MGQTVVGGNVLVTSNGKLVVQGGTLDGNMLSNEQKRNVTIWDNGIVNVSGGTFLGDYSGNGGCIIADKGATITISGGTFSGSEHSDVAVALAQADNVSKGTTLTVSGGNIASLYVSDVNTKYDPAITISGKTVIKKLVRDGDTKPVIAFALTEGANVCISGDKADEVFGTGSSTPGISSDNGMAAVLDGSKLKWSDVLLGDFTEDGLVTDADVIYLLWYTVFPEDYPMNGKADFTGDGLITDADVIYLLWYTVFPDDYPLK